MTALLPYPDPLVNDTALSDQTATVCVTGEVDLVTADLMRIALLHALSRQPRCLVVDLCDVVLLGTAGLTALMIVQSVAAKAHIDLRLRSAHNHQVQRALRLSGTRDLFQEYPMP